MSESISDPENEPVVWISPEMRAWFADAANGGCPECNGINWFHAPGCSASAKWGHI
jgi:hypothetical protein